MDTTTVNLVLGVLLLILGRALFWFFVGVAGFLAGMNFADRLLAGGSDMVKLAIALIAGVVGAVLAIFVQKVLIAIAGFIIGGYILVQMMHAVGNYPESWTWIALIIGGVVGLVLVLALFDWAIIILSSLSGSMLVVQSAHLARSTVPLAFFGLALAGIVVQAFIMRGSRRPV